MPKKCILLKKQVFSTYPTEPLFFLTKTFAKDPARRLKLQIQTTLSWIYKKLCKYSYDFLLVAEFTDASRIHYHTIYLPKNKGSMITLVSMLKTAGFVKNEKIKNFENTFNYLIKELYIIRRIYGNTKCEHNYLITRNTDIYRLFY